MGEVIDYLFFFWVFVTIAVYVVGSIYEKQVRNRLKAELRNKRRASLLQDEWSPYSSDTNSSLAPNNHDYNSSQQYNNNNNERYPSRHSTSGGGGDVRASLSHYSNASAAYSPTATGDTAAYGRQHQTAPTSSYQMSGQPQYGASYPYETSYGAGDATNYAGLKRTSIEQSYHRQPEVAMSSSYNQQDYSPARHHQQSAVAGGGAENSIPTATGFNGDCVEWVNRILYLFFTQSHKYGPIITESIYRSLNEKLANITSSSSAEYNNVSVEFTGINCEMSTKPELTNIRTETESDKSVSAMCKIYNRRLVFDLTIAQRTNPNSSTMAAHDQSQLLEREHAEVSHYELTLENLEGKLKSMAMLSDKLIVIQFMEKPDTKILLRPKYHSSHRALINDDTLVGVILQTLTQVVVDLYFGDDPDFPQYKQHQSTYRNKLNLLKGSASEIKRQIKHDFFGALTSSSESKERKIFIKILRAKNINYNQNVTCLLELDTPYQQALSSTKQGSNPYWDEHFLFNINDKSNELVIELWDSISLPHDSSPKKGAKSMQSTSGQQQQQQQTMAGAGKRWNKAELTSASKFLGLAKISIEELRRNPVQKQNVMLQSMAHSGESTTLVGGPGSLTMVTTDLNNSVGGELQVELVFLEHSAASGLQKSNSANSIAYQHGDVVSVDRKLTPSGYVITTTTITKPTGKQQSRQSRYDQLSVRNQSPISSTTAEQSDLDNLDGISSQVGDGIQSSSTTHDREQSGGGRSSRSRSRSRSFLRAIKKRFSFSRTRSRSVGESGAGALRSEAQSALGGNLDAVSIESRSRASSEMSLGGARAKSVPASRDPSEVPTIVINKGRLSDTASAFTFTHPKSQLVIECKEPTLSADGIGPQKTQLRHYAITENMANKGKWRKKGTKLHLVNEHQFVACHLTPSSTCHLCGRVFSRRPGKQGYKCRNCHLLSHKECHVKVDHNCPYATRDGLKLEYIDADPPAMLTMADGSTATSQRQSETLPRQRVVVGQTNRPMRMSAKSISMEVDDR